MERWKSTLPRVSEKKRSCFRKIFKLFKNDRLARGSQEGPESVARVARTHGKAMGECRGGVGSMKKYEKICNKAPL